MEPEVLLISGVEVPYFFGLSAKIAFEEKHQKDGPTTLRETLDMHYLNYVEACRLRKADVKLTFEEFVDLLDKDINVNMKTINEALQRFSQGKK